MAKTQPDNDTADLWPACPTREECNDVGFETTFDAFSALQRYWPLLTVDQKAQLGFTREHQLARIDRFLVDHRKRVSHDSRNR